jgi:hypothetical protein
MYLNALNLSFVLYYYHVYERGRSGETMTLSPVLIIRRSLVTFALYYFQYFKPKNHKKTLFFVSFGFINLRVVGA